MSFLVARAKKILRKLVNFFKLTLLRGTEKLLGSPATSPLYNTVEYCFKKAASVGLHRFAIPFWGAVLQFTGRRYNLIEWYKWAISFDYSEYSRRLLIEKFYLGEDFTEDYLSFYKKFESVFVSDKIKAEVRALYLLQESEQLPPEVVFDGAFMKSDPYIIKHAYRKIWLAHTMMDHGKLEFYARTYAEAIDYRAKDLFHLIEKVLFAARLYDVAIDLLDKMAVQDGAACTDKPSEVNGDKPHLLSIPGKGESYFFSKTSRKRESLRHRASLESGLVVAGYGVGLPEDVTERNIEDFFWAGQTAKANSDEPLFFQYMRKYLSSAYRLKGENIARAHFELACYYEKRRAFKAAEMHFERMLAAEGVPFYLPITTWRYVSYLMAVGRWKHASALMVQGLAKLWRLYAGFSRIGFKKRLKEDKLIPENGCLILGCQGLGDDLIRLGLLHRYVDIDHRFGMTCDPRMLPLLQRSFPKASFFAPSRRNGPFAVSERDYWKDREGSGRSGDPARVSRAVIEAAKRYPDVIVSEAIFLHYVMNEGSFPDIEKPPMLKVNPDKEEKAKQYLASLPGRLKVGVSWRSGVRNATRNEYYVDVTEMGAIFGLDDVSFVSLQYSDTSEEEQEILDAFGCTLYKMPGVDLKDDLDGVAALCRAVDVVVVVCTTVREMAGAVGARTISMTTTPVMPDIWRTDEKNRRFDVIFPSIEHETYYEHDSKEAVIKAVAVRLKAMLLEADGSPFVESLQNDGVLKADAQ